MTIMNRNIEIKLINSTDLDTNKSALINLLNDNLKINFPDFGDLMKYAVNGYDDMVRYNQDNSAILIGAFDQGIIIGIIWAYRKRLFEEKRIHIGHIVVDSTIRSAGIGTKLLQFLENISENEGIKKIELITTKENENTIKFYESKGFSKIRIQLEKDLGEINENR